MTTKILGSQITNYTIDTQQLTNTAVAAFAQSLAPKITTVNVANSGYTVLDDTAVNIGGGYIVITGADFQSGASVLIDATPATSVTYVNTTTLRAEVPSKSAASYNLYVVNPDGGTGIRVAGLTYSATPTWVTTSPLANKEANVAFNLSFDATSATSYSNTTALPAGTTLLANGYFYGTVTIGAETTYTFTVRATDAELQDADKTFSVTFTVAPTYELFMWGRSAYGQIPENGSSTLYTSPIALDSTQKWTTITTNWSLGAGIKAGSTNNGTLWLWGLNSYGQLGLNDIVSRSSPVQVGSATNWALVKAASYNIIATKTDGTLWTWGRNQNGQLGLNDIVSRSSPTQVGTGTTWNKINGGDRTCGSIKTDGTLWLWGSNYHGQLGVNDKVFRSSPTQVGTNTNWSIFSMPGSLGEVMHISAIKTDGTLWAWGNAGYSQLTATTGANQYRSSPGQVGSDTNWSRSAASGTITVAIKSTGTLWAWGDNTFGQLGQNNRTNRISGGPLQVGTDTTWSRVYSSGRHVIAIKTNNTLWAWGQNGDGQLGQNDTVNRSSPVQVGTSTKWTITASEQSSSNAFVSLSDSVVFALREV